MLTLGELFERRGLSLVGNNGKPEFKMMRHVDDPELSEPLVDLRREHFEEYQSFQSQQRLRDKRWLLSFLSWPSHQARLQGVYQVGKCHQRGYWQPSESFPCRDRQQFITQAANYYFYDLQRDERFIDLEGRLIITWPARLVKTWHIAYRDNFQGCPVVEVLPENYSNGFPGFGPLIIGYEKLRRIFDRPLAYREWKAQLESVGGVYLITAEGGHQYVGSASGRSGIWGRWSDYARNATGENAVLKALLKRCPGIEASFKFSVLRTFDIGTARSEAVQMEEQLRRKLGDRAIALE